jgi:rhodanese-related sulfurtransferase
MGQSITKSVKNLLTEANKSIETISALEAIELLGSEEHIFIKREGKIPGAFLCPRGVLEFWIDPESPSHKELFNQDKKYVFYCASGGRSALSAKTASDMGLTPVCHVEGGFSAWKKTSGDIENVS